VKAPAQPLRLARPARSSIHCITNGYAYWAVPAAGGTLIAPTCGVDCFFGTCDLPSHQPDGKTAIVMFCIPEIGIRFKAPFAAVDRDHADLASLLALLEFIDSNQKHLSGQAYQLFGDNRSVINQVNGQVGTRAEFIELMNRAALYRDKYRFSLAWVPSADNQAVDDLLG